MRVAREARDGRDGRRFEVRSSRCLELRTQNSELLCPSRPFRAAFLWARFLSLNLGIIAPDLSITRGATMAEKDDKKRALDLALSQIEKQYGKGAIMKLGGADAPVDIPAISTGSLGLDIALGVGGLPRGRVI